VRAGKYLAVSRIRNKSREARPASHVHRRRGRAGYHHELVPANPLGAQTDAGKDALQSLVGAAAFIAATGADLADEPLGEYYIDLRLIAQDDQRVSEKSVLKVQLNGLGTCLQDRNRREKKKDEEPPHFAEDLDLP
jgi:hypothetical protein